MAIPKSRPTKRIIDLRSLSYGLSGPVAPYPVYQFSEYRTKIEYDRHNPFLGVGNGDNLGHPGTVVSSH
jgi:hypothetical protein